MKKETDVIKDIRNLFKCMNEKLKKKRTQHIPCIVISIIYMEGLCHNKYLSVESNGFK